MIAALRLACYVVGIMFASGMAMQLFRLEHRLAKAFGAAMVGWALNTALLGALLLYLQFTGMRFPVWRDVALSLNALLLAACPVALYVVLMRDNG